MIIRKRSAVVHQTQHYKLYKSGKYLVTSAIMGLSVLGALTFNNPTRVHADSTAKDQAEDVNEDGNAVTTTSASATPITSSNNEQSIYTDSKVNQETAPVRATAQTTNSTANNLEQGQTSGDAATNHLNIINLNAALQQNTQSSQNEKSLMTNMAVSNEAAQTDVINKVKATGVTPNTNQVIAITDYGALGDGQTDDTQALQKALDSINQAGGGVLDIPTGDYMIKTTNATNEAEATIPWQTNQGVKVPSNTTLYFEKGAKLSVIPNASWNYCLLNLANSKNVNILNGELVGDRDKHDIRYTKAFRTTTKYQGETGWGILMTGAQNVNIIGNNIHDFWGDGIDLYGDNANPGVNQNIVIKDNTLNHNRRQGISVENVNGLVFDHNLVENTDGTAPRAGMDIEPANFKDPSLRIAHDITITNNTFRNNNGSGLMTYGLSTHAEGFSDGPSRISNLTIKNNTFDGNNTNSFAVEGTAGEGAWNWQQNMNGQLTVLGTSNATVENNKFINANPKGININEANGDANAVITANTYKTAGMFVGFNENAQIHNNYLQGQDIFVTGNQSPSYAFNNISGSVTNNYANAVIANGTLKDDVKKAVVPDNQNYKDTAATSSFIATTGVVDDVQSGDQTTGIKQAANADTIVNEAKSYGVTPVTKNVVTLSDYGIVGDSTTDVTAKIQNVLDLVKNNGGGIVYVPAGTYMIRADDQKDPVLGWQNNHDGLQVGPNTTILLDKNATLKAIANPASGYTILNLVNADNSNVLGGTIEGDRYTHLLTTPFNIRNGVPFYGEWGVGTSVTGGDHVSLIGTTYKNFWGDGVSVFPGSKTWRTDKQATNLLIKNCVFDHNRRQGVSLGNVNGAVLEGNLFENTNGTGPASGLDLEPGDSSNETVENVTIKNNVFQNNTNQGLTMYAASGTHVRNIKVLNNTFIDNGSWINGQVSLNQVEGAELANNKVISDDGSRFYGIVSMSSSNVNVHDNYLPNGSIVVTQDNPGAGFASPSGSVENNYASSVTINHRGFTNRNNQSPSQADASVHSKIGADWNADDKTTHPDTITNEKLTLTGFNSRGKAYNVTANPKDTVLGNYDPMNWKGSFSFDIDGALLHHKSTGDDVIKFEKPMFTLYHNQDDQANLGTDELYLGNQGKPIYINGQNVGTLYSSYIMSNGTFTGTGIQHVTVDDIDMGDGRLHITGADHTTANETLITTADGKKYGFSFKAADGSLNIPEDKSLEEPVKTVINTYELVDDDNNGAVVGNQVTVSGTVGSSKSLSLTVPTNYQLAIGQVLPTTVIIADNRAITKIHVIHVKQTVNDSKNVTRTIVVTDPNGEKANHVQTVTLTRTGTKDLVTNETTWGDWSTGSFPSYQAPEIDGYTANQSVPAMTVTSGTQDSTVNVNYQKDVSVLDQIKNYKYLYMGFDPSQATKENPWKAIVALTASNDGINWTLIKEYPQLGTFRDADVNKIGDTYYIVGTLGAYKTKDLEHFEPVDFSAISSKQDDDTYHDTWAPELFQDLSGHWHVIYCAKTKGNQQNVYLADFDPATGVITNAWNQISGLHAIDPHIWTHNNKYYLTLNGTHLYTASDYRGPWTELKTNLADTLATTGHWYEAGETLTDGNKLYYYFDNIDANSDLPEDSGHMMVTTADINDPTKWTTPEPVQSSITMRHGSFINQQQAPLSFTIKVIDTDNNNQELSSTQVSALPTNYQSLVPQNYVLVGEYTSEVIGVGGQLTIKVRHQKQIVKDNKTVKRQIVLNRPERQIDATQEVTLTHTGAKDLVTGQITWGTWSTDTFQKFEAPSVPGYTASQIVVPAEHVDSNTKDSTVTISYSPSQQTINIKYLDGDQVIKTVPITGNTGENVDINVDVPAHYHVTNHVPKTYLLKAEDNEDVIVELAHDMQHVNDSKTIQRTISLTAPDGKQTTTKQSATITRQGTKDLVTNKTTWDNWSLATLPVYEAPSFAGYQPTLTKVEAEPVDGDTKDSTIDISYVADKQSVNIIYKDGQQVIKTVPLTGKTGETVKVPLEIPANYQLVNHPAESYTFKDENNSDIIVELSHETKKVHDTKKITRTIKITYPDGQMNTIVQPVIIYRSGSEDPLTGNITWGEWSKAKWEQYNAEELPGYTATNAEIPEQAVDGNTLDTTVEIAYLANPQSVKVIYKDGDQVIKTTSLTGKTGENIDINVDVPAHYHVDKLPTKTYTFKAMGNSDVVVELGHDTQSADDSKLIIRVIKITHPDGQITTEIQKATITRTGSKDAVTDKITWNNWSTAKWKQYNATKIPGYTSTMPVVSEQKVTSDTPDTTVEIKYVANSQQTNLIYKDGNKVVKMTTLNGKTDETVDVNLDVPEHYHVVNQVARTYSFKADHNDDVIVELGHDIQQVSDSHTINRTINLISPDGTKKAIKQSASLNRMGLEDLVTGDITWNGWSDAQLPEYEVPVLDGYTASQSKVAAEKVTSDTQDSTVNITYAANQQSISIIYKDGNQVVRTIALKGNTDETVKVPTKLPANYHIIGNAPTNYTFKAKENQDIVINLGHDTQIVSQSKTIKRSIHLDLPDGTGKSVVQQVTFTRHGIKDLVTGKTTWGSWDHNGKYQFDSYTPQKIAGYEVTPDKLDPLLVTPDSKDSELTVSYHKLVTKPTVKPQTPQKPAAYTSKVQISQVSQPVTATQPKSEPQQELPQTGNDNEAALATGFMGLLLAIGSLGFGKKYRI